MNADEPTEHDGIDSNERTEAVTRDGLDQSDRTIGVDPRQLAEEPIESFMLGPFHIIRELGRGGMGIVYLAEDPELKRRIALKVLPTALRADAALLARFRREAEVASRLDHPHLCGVLRVGESDGRPWIAMRYVEGQGLDQIIRNKTTSSLGRSDATTRGATGVRPELAPRLELMETVALALQQAHEAGVVHRDLKPGNVVIQKDGDPVILDFGLALDLLGDAGLTQSGDVLGTPYYMAPEQVRGHAQTADARVDVWALGVMLYELIAGVRPFEGATRDALYRAILEQDPPPLRRIAPGTPRDLETIVGTALQKAPEKRYASAQALADDLRALMEIRPIQARPASLPEKLIKAARRRPAVATLVLVTIVALPILVFLLTSRAFDRRRLGDALESSRVAAESDLAEGRLRSAGKALAEARRIDEKAPFLAELDARLRRSEDDERARLLALDEEADIGGTRALAYIDDLLARRPDAREPRLWRAVVHLRNKDRDAARSDLRLLGRDFEALLELGPDELAARPSRPDLLGLLEVALLQTLERPQQALGRLELLMEERPTDPVLPWLAAEQASRLQNYHGALAQAGRVRALVSELSPLQLGRYSLHLRRAGHVEEALRIANEALAAAPLDPIVRLHQATALDEAGRKEEALAAYASLGADAPDLAAVFRNHGAALIELDRSGEALPLLERATELAPGDADILVNLASSHQKHGDPALALANYDRALSIRPDFPYAWSNKAVALKDLGRHDEAIAAAQEALRLRPHYPECWFNLGTIHVLRGANDDAAQAFEKAASQDPSFVAALTGAGVAHLKAERFTIALSFFEKAKLLDPADAKIWIHLPLVFEGLNRPADALLAGSNSIRLHPEEVQGWLNYGSAVINAGQRDHAIPIFEEALGLFPDEGRMSLPLVPLLAEGDTEASTALILRMEDRDDPFYQHIAQFTDTLVTAIPTLKPQSLMGRACALRVAAADGLDDEEKARLAAVLTELEATPATGETLDRVRVIAVTRTLARLAETVKDKTLTERARKRVEVFEAALKERAARLLAEAMDKASREPERSGSRR